MSISTLATVELQLIMHQCDRISLVSLARCCRFTLASASADFAWKSISPLRLDFHDEDFTLGSKIHNNLIRFCTIALTWIPPIPEHQPTMPVLHALGHIPRLVDLNATRRNLDPADMNFLARHIARPSGLTSLGFKLDWDPGGQDDIGLALLQHHPLLTTLSLNNHAFPLLSTVAYSTEITSLHLVDSTGEDVRALHTNQFTTLRSLTLNCVFEGVLHSMLTSSELQTLEKLHICNVFGRGAGMQFTHRLGLMRSLRTCTACPNCD
jgi:hypothetical protein